MDSLPGSPALMASISSSTFFILWVAACSEDAAGLLGSTLSLTVQSQENGSRRRAISGSLPNMMEPYDPSRVDENVAPSLADISFRLPGETTKAKLLKVSPPCTWSPGVPKGSFEHVIVLVQFTSGIDQERPAKACVLGIALGEKPGFEGHDHNLHIQAFYLGFILLQLQQMPSAGQSPQVPVKDHQKPRAPIIIEAVSLSPGVRKCKRDSRLPHQTAHKKPQVLSGVPGPVQLL